MEEEEQRWEPAVSSTSVRQSNPSNTRSCPESLGGESSDSLPCGQSLTETGRVEQSPSGPGSSTRQGDGSQGAGGSSKEEDVLSRLSKLEESLCSIREQLATPAKSRVERRASGFVQKGQMVDTVAKTASLYGKLARPVNELKLQEIWTTQCSS